MQSGANFRQEAWFPGPAPGVGPAFAKSGVLIMRGQFRVKERESLLNGMDPVLMHSDSGEPLSKAVAGQRRFKKPSVARTRVNIGSSQVWG